jgi:hypothetical protein
LDKVAGYLAKLNTCSDNTYIMPSGIKKIILRLANPKEYQGNIPQTMLMIEYLNKMLVLEGFEIVLEGPEPRINEVDKKLPAPVKSEKSQFPEPDFKAFISDPELTKILKFRFQEAIRCYNAKAYMATVILLGSILEGVLLDKIESDKKKAGRAVAAKKDKKGDALDFKEWPLSSMIDTALELGWIRLDAKKFCDPLREYRNMIHPYEQRKMNTAIDESTCVICWEIIKIVCKNLKP